MWVLGLFILPYCERYQELANLKQFMADLPQLKTKSAGASAGRLIAVGAKQVRKYGKKLVSSIIEINIVGTAITRETDFVAKSSCSSIMVYVHINGVMDVRTYTLVCNCRTDVCV